MKETPFNEQSNPLIEKSMEYDSEAFSSAVTTGLLESPKRLDSKYFYDAKGDTIFQEIMKSPEYYLSRCELEIISKQSKTISTKITQDFEHFNLIELGPGDATKSIHLLHALKDANTDFTYIPIDISGHVIQDLEANIPNKIHGLKIKGYAGEYLEMLKKVVAYSDLPKVILFLGSTIGNLNTKDSLSFCRAIHGLMNQGDILFIGFDLIKNPDTILAAYNDTAGLTKEFNLNLLARINQELGANFNLDSFKHFPSYNPTNGICSSFLISKIEQSVFIERSNVTINFKKHEPILMEISKKYSVEEIVKLAQNANFYVETNFSDRKNWFLDSLWKVE